MNSSVSYIIYKIHKSVCGRTSTSAHNEINILETLFPHWKSGKLDKICRNNVSGHLRKGIMKVWSLRVRKQIR